MNRASEMKITSWYARTHYTWEHNHIEDGHVNGRSPTPKTEYQERCWKNKGWRKYHAQLIDGVVTYTAMQNIRRRCLVAAGKITARIMSLARRNEVE